MSATVNVREILISGRENQLIEKLFPVIDRTNIVQDRFFLLGHSNFVNSSFVTELNKFFLIYNAVSYFGKKKMIFIKIISPKNRVEFLKEKL